MPGFRSLDCNLLTAAKGGEGSELVCQSWQSATRLLRVGLEGHSSYDQSPLLSISLRI